MPVYNQAMSDWTELTEKHLGITLSDLQRFQFQVVQEELLLWNEKINLTAIKDIKGTRKNTFLILLPASWVLKSGLRV